MSLLNNFQSKALLDKEIKKIEAKFKFLQLFRCLMLSYWYAESSHLSRPINDVMSVNHTFPFAPFAQGT